MKQNNKKLILITIMVCIFALAGCKNVRFNTYKESEQSGLVKTEGQEQSDIEDVEKNEKTDTLKATDNGDTEEPTPTLIQPAANTELMIYTVNGDGEIENVTAMIPVDNEITPELILQTVVDSMADNSLMIGIESVKTEKDAVIVSFTSDKPPVSGIGASYETAILDAIAQSLIDNLDNYSKVIYRVEGSAYIGGHVELDFNEVYLGD